METILTICTPLLIGILALAIFALMKREKKRKNEGLDKNDFVLRSSYVWGAFMLAIIIFLLFLIVFGNLAEPMGGINVVFVLLILILSYGSLQIFREKVRVKDTEIIYTPAIGKTKVYTFEQIEKIVHKRTGYYVYINGKAVFSIDSSGIGTCLFTELARDKGVSIE
ncbi:MAG: hypothetical protein J6B29_00950 [Clostridia bacterium]|nr:hypothetical protein [Clostridia bacterium]